MHAQDSEIECVADSCLLGKRIHQVRFYQNAVPDSAKAVYRDCIRLADSMSYLKGRVNGRYHLAGLYSTLSEFDSANHYLEETLQLGIKYKKPITLGAVYLSYGNNARAEGKYDDAALYFDMSYEQYQKIDHKKGISSNLMNMAILYKTQEQYDLAMVFYRKAIVHNEKDHDTIAIFNAMINIAATKGTVGERDSASYFFNQARKLLNCTKINDYKRAQFYSSGALFYHFQIDSLRHYVEQFEAHLPPKNRYLLASLFVQKGQLYYNEGRYSKGIMVLNQAIALADSIHSWEHKKTALQLLHKSYSESGDFELALETYKELEFIKDSLMAEDTQFKLKAFEKQFESEKQERELAESLFENEQEKALRLEAEKNTSTLIWVVSILVLIAIVIGLFYTKLNRQKKVIETTLGEKEVLLGEVHHRVKNNLQLISSILDMQMRSIEDKEAVQALLESQNKVNAVAIIHQKLYKSTNFSAIDSKEYLEDLLQTVISTLRPSHFNLREDIQLAPLELSLNKSIPLGLILTELMNNAFKHGFSNSNNAAISIVFKELNGSCLLQVSNTGALKEDGVNGGFGLKMVHSLARQLKGDFKIEQNKTMTVAELTFPN